MKKFLISTTVVVSLCASLVFASFAVAQAVHHHSHERGMFGQRMAKELNLTEAQQGQIKSIFDAEKPKMGPLMQQLRSDEQQMREATKGGAFDEAKVTALANDEAQVRAKLSVERARVHSQIFQVLTPEQRTKMESMRKDFREGKGRGMHRHKGDKSEATEKQ